MKDRLLHYAELVFGSLCFVFVIFTLYGWIVLAAIMVFNLVR
jgi:hypothetical protein